MLIEWTKERMGGWVDFLPNDLVKNLVPSAEFLNLPSPPNFWHSTPNATATIQLCKHLCFAKRGTQSAYPFSILCSHLIFLNSPLLWFMELPQTQETEPQIFLSTPPDQPVSITLTSQHLFLLCTKINQKALLTNFWKSARIHATFWMQVLSRWQPSLWQQAKPREPKAPTTSVSLNMLTTRACAHTSTWFSSFHAETLSRLSPCYIYLNNNSRPWTT